MADHENQAVEEMCRAMCAAAVGKPGYEHAMAWDDWDEESREIGRAIMTAAYRAIPAAPDPRDEVIWGLCEALEDALDAWDTHNRYGDHMQGHWVSDALTALAEARKLGVG